MKICPALKTMALISVLIALYLNQFYYIVPKSEYACVLTDMETGFCDNLLNKDFVSP